MLVEIPTVDETADNIVAFWTPQEPPQSGGEYLYGYRLYWCRDNPRGPKLATVRATRTGIGGIVGQKRNHFAWRFVVDFAGGELALLAEHARVMPTTDTIVSTLNVSFCCVLMKPRIASSRN